MVLRYMKLACPLIFHSIPSRVRSSYHNIIYIHNNVLWDWKYFTKYSHIQFFIISDVSICRFSRSSMLLVWMAPLTLAVIIMRGLIFQPCALKGCNPSTNDVAHHSMRSARNTKGTRGTLEWHPGFVVPLVRGPKDPSVGEGPGCWERLPPMEIKSHEGKAMSYK